MTDLPLESLGAVAAGAAVVALGLGVQLQRANKRIKALSAREPAVHPVLLAEPSAPKPEQHTCEFSKKPDGYAGAHNQWRLHRCLVPGCTNVKTECGVPSR